MKAAFQVPQPVQDLNDGNENLQKGISQMSMKGVLIIPGVIMLLVINRPGNSPWPVFMH